MDKESLIELTKSLYKITLLFPKKEPLRYKMREAAVNILTATRLNFDNVVLDLEVLDSFFSVAMAQNWVKQEDILAVKVKYDSLKDALETDRGLQAEEVCQETAALQNGSFLKVLAPRQNSERKERIVDFLRENGRVQVWQIKQILPDVSKRTLRRDFEQMLSQGVVERIGERNDTFYQLKFDRG